MNPTTTTSAADLQAEYRQPSHLAGKRDLRYRQGDPTPGRLLTSCKRRRASRRSEAVVAEIRTHLRRN